VIGDKYNIYYEILKGLNRSKRFTNIKDSSYMMNRVRELLR